MPRELKFRVWNRETKEMYLHDVRLGGYHEAGAGWLRVYPFDQKPNPGTMFANNGNFTRTDPNDCELMQFTGLKDAKGVEIYEGDLIECSTIKTSVRREVAFSSHHAAFVGRVLEHTEDLKYSGQGLTQQWIDDLDIGICGNIYENPELLENTNETCPKKVNSIGQSR